MHTIGPSKANDVQPTRIVPQKKVAFVATIYRHIEAFHLPYIDLLQKKGYEVHVYARLDDGKHAVSKAGALCHDIPFERSPLAFSNMKLIRPITESFRNEGFQFVHVHTPVGSVIGRLAARRANVPTVLYTAHGFHFYLGAPLHYWAFIFPVEYVLSRSTDYLITINPEDYKRAQNFPVRRQVLYVPGVGVDSHVYGLAGSEHDSRVKSSKRDELGVAEEDFVILCVAEFTKNKNQIQLAKAMKILVTRIPHIRCVFAGSGSEEERMKSIVESWKIEEYFRFLGYRRDIPELLQMADIVALMSFREGLPKSLLEALAVAKPILGTNSRGIRDLVHHGKNGFLVPPSDVNATVVALERMVRNQGLLSNMGRTSQSMSRQFELCNVIKEMDRIYESVMSEPLPSI